MTLESALTEDESSLVETSVGDGWRDSMGPRYFEMSRSLA
jgi:hypothetical protein